MLISVVIATKNRPSTLYAAARSILDGEYHHLELIIVDDGSSADTWCVISRLQEEDGRVQGIRLSESIGCVAARNRGVGFSSGQFIAFMDDDDIALPNRISS